MRIERSNRTHQFVHLRLRLQDLKRDTVAVPVRELVPQRTNHLWNLAIPKTPSLSVQRSSPFGEIYVLNISYEKVCREELVGMLQGFVSSRVEGKFAVNQDCGLGMRLSQSLVHLATQGEARRVAISQPFLRSWGCIDDLSAELRIADQVPRISYIQTLGIHSSRFAFQVDLESVSRFENLNGILNSVKKKPISISGGLTINQTI